MNPIRAALAECLVTGELVVFHPWADGDGLLVGRVIELTETRVRFREVDPGGRWQEDGKRWPIRRLVSVERGTPYLAQLTRLLEDDGPDDAPREARRPAEIRTLLTEIAGRPLAVEMRRKGERLDETVLVDQFEDDVATLSLFLDGVPFGRLYIPVARIRSLRVGQTACRRGRLYQACSSESARP